MAGVVPIRHDGRVIGALGIGGGAPGQDHAIAVRAVVDLAG
ncbi:heme-binding protein [Micromonospora pallida]